MLEHAIGFFNKMKKQCNDMYKTMKESQDKLGAELEKEKKTNVDPEATKADLRACRADLDVSRVEVVSLKQELEATRMALNEEKASSSATVVAVLHA